jgi:hypothetical protein
MSEHHSQEGKNEFPLWSFTRLDRFRRPPASARETVRKGFRGLWDRIRRRRLAPEPPTLDIELEAMPGTILAEAAPDPDWRDAAPALHEALQDWWAGENVGKVRVLIGAPYSGTQEIVAHWASAHGCHFPPEPTPEEIIRGNQGLEQLDQGPEKVWVIPRLERFYVRQGQGLNLVRRLLEKINTSPGRFLLACDSWAWAYLSQTLNIDVLMPWPLVLEAFDQKRLGYWLRDLASQGTEKKFVFRQADNGKMVLPPKEKDRVRRGDEESGSNQGGQAGPEKLANFLEQLAALSRGNPGVAWAIWRYCLRLTQEEEVPTKAQEVAAKEGWDRTIWVKPLSQVSLPALPEHQMKSPELFVLHALLLHDGLPGRVLAGILPFPESQTMGSLQRLRATGVVAAEADRWRVTAAAYPSVRDFLQQEGYLVDAL